MIEVRIRNNSTSINNSNNVPSFSCSTNRSTSSMNGLGSSSLGGNKKTTITKANERGNNSSFIQQQQQHHQQHHNILLGTSRKRNIVSASLFKIRPCRFFFVSLLAMLLAYTIIDLQLFRKKRQQIFKRPLSNKNHIPYPPVGSSNSKNVSVVVMNHGRPGVLLQSNLLSTLITHPTISEIIICHSNSITLFNNTHILEQYTVRQKRQGIGSSRRNDKVDSDSITATTTLGSSTNPDTDKLYKNITFDLLQQKVKHMDATEVNNRIGLAVRFFYCNTASNDWIIVVDDDMEIDHSAINELIHAMTMNSKRIIGHYGRTYNYWKCPFRHGYDTKLYTGTVVEVVLTKVLIVERDVCHEFFRHTHLVDQDIVPLSKPKWNGEDIFLNLVANHYYNVPLNGPYNNYAIHDLHVWEADPSLSTLDIVVPNDKNKILSNNTSTIKTPALDELYERLYHRSPLESLTSTRSRIDPLSSTTADSSNASTSRPLLVRSTSNREKQKLHRKKTAASLSSSLSVSGNLDRVTLWNSGPVAYTKAIFKAMKHANYRGQLWYNAKQRLAEQD